MSAFRLVAAANLMLISLGSCGAASETTGQKSWPVVKPIDTRFSVSMTHDGFVYHIPILTKNDEEVYKISCYSGDDNDRDQWSNTISVDPLADLSCVMFGKNQKYHWSSLFSQKDDDRDWQSRGFFWKSEIVGKCGSYPEFGRSRNFYLRGMAINMTLEPAENKDRWTMHLKIKNAPEHQSEWAEAPNAPDHAKECH